MWKHADKVPVVVNSPVLKKRQREMTEKKSDKRIENGIRGKKAGWAAIHPHLEKGKKPTEYGLKRKCRRVKGYLL